VAGAKPPTAGDLAAFVHTGGTTGAPKVAAHTHANQLACARGIAQCSGLAPGEGMLGGLPSCPGRTRPTEPGRSSPGRVQVLAQVASVSP